MREFQAEVVDIRDEGATDGRRRWRLLLTESLFDGVEGVLIAVSPGGTRLEVPVLGVVVEETEVWHVVEKPLAAGTPVTGRVYGAGERGRLSAMAVPATLEEFVPCSGWASRSALR